MSAHSPSRRDFLTGSFRRALSGAAEAAQSRLERLAPTRYLRPPGARSEAEFLVACTRCGDCVPVCPPGALSLLPPSAGVAAETPVITPVNQPCLMCSETQCITACEPRALVRDGPIPAIGCAEVDATRCWSAQGQDCDYCARDCRRHVDAIALERGGTPTVDKDRCDGCGLCEYICPVAGKPAITVIPFATSR